MPQALTQPDMLEHLGGRLAGIAAVGQFERQHDVFKCCEVAHQLKTLKHETHLLRTQRGPAVFTQRKQILAVKPHGAARRRIKARNDGQQRAFSRAGRANNGHGFPRLQAEIDITQNVQCAGGIRHRLEYMLDRNNGFGW